jgi:hypothetical protein
MKYKLILLIILLGLVGHVYACKCGEKGTIKESFKYTDLIIYGKVLSKEIVSFEEAIKKDKTKDVKEKLKIDTIRLKRFESYRIYKLKLEVIKGYKGGEGKDTVTIFTTMNSASCGYKFQDDKTYIIYASKRSNVDGFIFAESDKNKGLERENTYWTTICTRTTEYNKLEDDGLTGLRKKSG